jgi:hypothetical protein
LCCLSLKATSAQQRSSRDLQLPQSDHRSTPPRSPKTQGAQLKKKNNSKKKTQGAGHTCSRYMDTQD